MDVATLPEDQEFAPGLSALFATASPPENEPFGKLLFQNGLQRPDGIELDLGAAISRLRRESSAA